MALCSLGRELPTTPVNTRLHTGVISYLESLEGDLESAHSAIRVWPDSWYPPYQKIFLRNSRFSRSDVGSFLDSALLQGLGEIQDLAT